MGLTALYAAFAVVVLWLVGELLLQRRAPLPWRALALLGFLALVGGVAGSSLPLIGAGVLGFGAGQYLASRAVKAGGGPYWVLVRPERVPFVGRLFGAGGDGGDDAGAGPSQLVVVGEVGPVEDVDPLPDGGSGAPGGEPVVATAEDSVYFGPADDPSQEQQGSYAYTPEYAPEYARYDAYAVAADPTQQPQQQTYAEADYASYAPQYGSYESYQQPQTYPDYGQSQYHQSQLAHPTYEQSPYEQEQYDSYGYAQSAEYGTYGTDPYAPYPAAAYQDYSASSADYAVEAGAYPQQPTYTYPYPEEHLHQG